MSPRAVATHSGGLEEGAVCELCAIVATAINPRRKPTVVRVLAIVHPLREQKRRWRAEPGSGATPFRPPFGGAPMQNSIDARAAVRRTQEQPEETQEQESDSRKHRRGR